MALGSLPPAQPTYILRGHAAQIHALHFLRGNSRLLTGDADGWVVCWDVTYKRPVTVWRPHENAILGFADWEEKRAVLTHGRDNRLIVWQLGLADETTMDKTLPLENSTNTRAQPWILHILAVNTMNFCSFSICYEVFESKHHTQSVLLAVPDTNDSEGIDVFHLPTERRMGTIAAVRGIKTGMVMALSICQTASSLVVAAGYESGHTMLYSRLSSADAWETLYSCRPHSQPSELLQVLSLFPLVDSTASYYFTSSADAMIAKHPFLLTSAFAGEPSDQPLKRANTKHSGQQCLRVRSDGKIFATAGWDSRVRVYSCKTMKEVAVLKWHREGCMAVAFAQIVEGVDGEADDAKLLLSPDPDLETAETVASSDMARMPRHDLDQHGQQQVPSTAHLERRNKAQVTHWLAAGSKDGKVSLWDIY